MRFEMNIENILKHKFYQIFVQSDIDKKFFEYTSEQICKEIPIIFISIGSEIKKPYNKFNTFDGSRYKIMNILDTFYVDYTLKNEVKYIRDMVYNRLDIYKESNESKIVDLMEVVDRNSNLDFMYGLINRRLSIVKHGPKKRIIYPNRFDVGNYILDPYHIYLLLSKIKPECDFVKNITSLNYNNEQDFHQKIINCFTNIIKDNIDKQNEYDYEIIKVNFNYSKMILEYQKFLLETDSCILLELIKKTFDIIDSNNFNLE